MDYELRCALCPPAKRAAEIKAAESSAECQICHYCRMHCLQHHGIRPHLTVGTFNDTFTKRSEVEV